MTTTHADLATELDALQAAVRADLGPADERYIRRVIQAQLAIDLGGRLLIYASLLFLPSNFGNGWVLFASLIASGILLLAIAKILATMELGHNIMHGQWDYLNDPHINSLTWEWDAFVRSDRWKHMHNINHHPWANVLGKDQDLGWGIMRVSSQQRWHPLYLLQPLNNLLVALNFQWAVVLQDLEIDPVHGPRPELAVVLAKLKYAAPKVIKQITKDYVLFPLLAGPFFLYVAAANAAANFIRNLWAFLITYCGHFPAGARVFTMSEIHDESRGHWYMRQMTGACNITGPRWLHLLTGHLSFQIEHHLFPDLPSRRLPSLAPRVQALALKYDLPYNSASLPRQATSMMGRILRLALPNRESADASRSLNGTAGA